MNHFKSILCLALISFNGLYVLGQEWKNLDPDELFFAARNEAFNGDRAKSKKMLRFALEENPQHEGIRILLARIYSWDEMPDSARIELNKVLNVHPENQDALDALIDVEMWDEKYDVALNVINQALIYHPTFEDFVYKNASVLNSLSRFDEAKETLTRLLALNPSHQKGHALLGAIEIMNSKYVLGCLYSVDFFSQTFDPAHYGSIQLSKQNNWGSSLVRLNYADRFNISGVQPELDLYPKIANGIYAYLNYGYSNSSIFPKNRIGAEIFSKLFKSMEASGGIRYLNFNQVNNVMIYTGSLGIYFKDYWVSLRGYITPDIKLGSPYSATLSARRYWQDSDNYLDFNIGAGFSPDERRMQSSTGLTGDNITLLKSQRIGIIFQRSLRPTVIITSSLALTRQELSFGVNNYTYINNISLGLKKKF